IQIQNVSGHVEVLVLDTGSHTTSFEIDTSQIVAQMGKVGLYEIEASQDQTRFTTRTGSALVVEHNNGHSAVLNDDKQTLVKTNDKNLTTAAAETSLLKNP